MVLGINQRFFLVLTKNNFSDFFVEKIIYFFGNEQLTCLNNVNVLSVWYITLKPLYFDMVYNFTLILGH